MDVLKVTKNAGTVVVLPAPAEIKWSISDLDGDGSGRNQNGDLFRDRVAVKRKIECSWLPMSAAKWQRFCQPSAIRFSSLHTQMRLRGQIERSPAMLVIVLRPFCARRRMEHGYGAKCP